MCSIWPSIATPPKKRALSRWTRCTPPGWAGAVTPRNVTERGGAPVLGWCCARSGRSFPPGFAPVAFFGMEKSTEYLWSGGITKYFFSSWCFAKMFYWKTIDMGWWWMMIPNDFRRFFRGLKQAASWEWSGESVDFDHDSGAAQLFKKKQPLSTLSICMNKPNTNGFRYWGIFTLLTSHHLMEDAVNIWSCKFEHVGSL